MLECKIGCLGPQRGWLPWATQQMPITVKNLFRKVSVVHNYCFQIYS